MVCSHHFPSYLLLVIVILATSGGGCHQDQSAALLRLRASFRFPDRDSNFSFDGRTLLPWKVDTSCCTWDGVTCDGTSGHVTALDLSRLFISGNLISSDIFELTSLRSLSLAFNNFDANPWPNRGFEKLTELKYLDLSYSGLSGALPVENGQLSNLVALNLSGLDLKNLSLHTLIDSLGNLQELHLEEVNISVSPSDLAHASSTNTTSGLKELTMRWCKITSGRLDTVLTKLPFLSTLILDDTNISGPTPVPEHFADFSSLAVLKLYNCGLTGTFPSWIFRIKSLMSLDVSGNENLCGELPEFIQGSALQGSILDLDLSSNNIGGHIPDWIWGIGSVALNLSHNSFTSVNTNLSNTSIRDFDLHSNKIEGALPLPPWGTYRVDYSNNHFNSSIMPEFWSRISSATSLSLANNSLIGEVSHLICRATYIEVLDLSFNSFSGLIPPCLLKHNERLEILNLRELQVLDLSSNSFNGSIPARFLKQFKAMMVISPGAPSMYVEIIATSSGARNNTVYRPYYRESVTVSLKGQETTLVQILSVFMYIDLSNNNFMGVIPNAIGDLKFLKQLNLSRNSFTGEIPPRIANMLQLESLDLSYNQLSGEIPPEMAAMSFLEVLNLSYNHLSGMIPQSSQFLTFPNTSFLGNDRLCGKPLARLCETNHAPSAAATPGSSKELNWEFLSVEVGVVSGLAIVAATMLLWGNGRGWVYWHVDKFWLQVLQPWICRRRR
ncbi:hypothetical protein C2845_PM14G15590 [Panicum miliaceum]|uniref:Leucine-rich repeat-containing N-terminal plant-type domain-containing protein n=1 Tax=Panicum miliaceum TaxID=4540 RepID=A0A3L6PML6_PANMI|nr:hypothetical protein C2845_PM14G15590 [Panicum miliaceum]